MAGGVTRRGSGTRAASRTPDLLRLRDGELGGAPDLVLLPGTHEQVLEALRICSSARIAVVPFGGGTSVVGGLEPVAEDSPAWSRSTCGG